MWKLRELGCQFGQGFYVSRPLPAEELLDLLRTTASRSTASPGAAAR